MGKKVLVISTSPRKDGNSEILAEEFAKGAKDAGNDVEFVTLRDKEIHFCKGCLACQKIGHCVMKDDANAITEKIGKAEVVAWATPIYYYEMSGQMKTMIDRASALFAKDYACRDIYLLTAAAEEESAIDGAVTGIGGWIACFEHMSLKGVVYD